MQYKNMEDKMVTDKYRFKFIGNSIMVGDNEASCYICGVPTKYIDVFSEGHFCSEECLHKFDLQMEEIERKYMDSIE